MSADYKAVLFYNSSDIAKAFKQDDATLLSALIQATGIEDLELKRETYEDGSWSGWYSLTSPSATSDSLKALGEKLETLPGMEQVMLKTVSGAVEPVHPYTGPEFPMGYGALNPNEQSPKKSSGPKGPSR